MTKSRDLADNSQNTKPKVVDAKGDLIVGTGADAADRLAVGSNGYTLVADSSTSTGLAYGSSALVNPIINGAYDIWQRGTSISIGTAFTYAADRWQGYRNTLVSGMTVSRQNVSDSTNLPNIQFAARIQRDSGNTSTQLLAFGSSLETANSIPFAGRTVTLSFYARAGANYSSASNALTAKLFTGTGTDQNILSAGYTGQANPINQTATLTTSWQRFAYSVTLATTTTEIGLEFSYTPTGTASTNDWFEITGCQIDLGSTALPFRRSGGTIQGELAACSRYYYRVDSANASDTRMNTVTMIANSTTVAYGAYIFPVRMRTSPTFGTSTASGWSLGRIAAACTAMAQERASQYSSMVKATVASGLTAGQGDWLEAGNNNTAWIEFSAEL